MLTESDKLSLVAIAVAGGIGVDEAWHLADALPAGLTVREASVRVGRTASDLMFP